ncbi:MAG: SDR family oxidoreductase [Alphaproteobacteria bacterium]|nr:SDR family oxidoreductase [Alphaproteobacteria bacterium]
MAGRVAGKVALVIGAGTKVGGWGNGKASAVLYGREGARVCATDLDAGAAEETAGIIRSEGGTAIAVAGDATRAGDIKRMVDACMTEWGRIDILHNNVGAAVPGGVVETSEADWDAYMALNLKSAFLACKLVVPIMERQGGGAIVNIASIAGIRFLDRPFVSYQASKAAMIEMSRAIAVQHAATGVRCNAVLPGLMRTPLVERRIERQYKTEAKRAEAMQARERAIPMRKMGDAWDTAWAALFLASDEARYVTGTEIVVDGGLTAKCV